MGRTSLRSAYVKAHGAMNIGWSTNHRREIKNMATEMKWISVKERLPMKGATVIVVIGGLVQWVMCYLGKAEWIWCDDEDAAPVPLSAVTHWMPLPDPPEAA